VADPPSDDEEVDDERLPECFGPLPSDLHFPLFGLSDTFTGQRFLFQWERLLGMDRPAPNPVAWVALVHRSDPRLLEVITFGKQPWTSFGQLEAKVDMKDVAYRALFGHLQLESMKMPLGEVRGRYHTAQLAVIERLAEDFDAPEWQHLSLVLEGEPQDALVYRQGEAWAAVLDLDEHLALGMRGVGIEPDEYELVAIKDLSRYPSQLATRDDESGPGFADAEDDDEPVTLGEAEEGLVFALAGVSQIAEILSDVLLYGEDVRKYMPQITHLKTMSVLVGSYAARLADHYHITLEPPFARDTADARALQNARIAAGLSLEDLAEGSGIDRERLRGAEGADAWIDLTSEEWVKLAVVFEGHTLVEFKDQQTAKGPVKWLAKSGDMLESARHLVRYHFSPGNLGSEDT
jgi:hypothetical protein